MERRKNKQAKLHIKKDDLVMIIAGDDKGKEGKVMEVDKKNKRAIVEGRNMVKKHLKPSASNPEGEIVEQEASIHISNLMVIDPSNNKPRRTKRVLDDNGKLKREFKTHTSLKEE